MHLLQLAGEGGTVEVEGRRLEWGWDRKGCGAGTQDVLSAPGGN